MATRDKAAGTTTAIRTLSNTAAWVGAVVPVAGNDARWISTSSSGAHTGSITCDRVIIEGASGNITYTTGTITFVSTGDFFRSINSSGRTFTPQGGTLALGGANRDCRLYTSTGAYTLQLTGANSITGTVASVINVINDLGTGSANNAYITVGNTQSGFLGTVRLTALSGIFTEATSSATSGFNAATIICDGAGWLIAPAIGTAFIGGSGRTLTINEDGRLGWTSRSLTVLSDVQLAGTGTRTLEVLGNTALSGTVTGSAGITLAGDTHYRNLSLPSGLLTGLSGAATLTGGGLDVPAGSWTPTAIDVGSNSRFRFTLGSSDYSFPRTPTGVGIVSIGGIFAGNGVTFPTSPAEGNIASFSGSVEAYSASGGNSKVRISELPGGLRLIGYAQLASNPQATITYTGAGHSAATTLVIDSEDNTQLGNLTAGTYKLDASGTGASQMSGTVQRTNSAATASARMNLTLGGSNTGDNTLSGAISEVGTNGAILGITKVDAGRWVLSGSNTHTGIHTISAGTLSAQSATALGSATSTGGVTISGSGALELAGGITLNKSVTDFTVSNATNPIQSIGTNELQTKQLLLSVTPTFTVTSGNKLTLAPQGVGVISGAQGLTKDGDGELELTAKANTFSGTLTVSAGTLTVASVANSGVAAAWGQASSAVLVSGALKYTGGAASTTRGVQMTGAAPTINASGTGALVLNSVTQDTNAKTMTLRGTNTDANTISSLIANNSGAVSLAKEDAGKWVLNGGLAHTGTTAVNGGTLRVETGNNNTASGAVTIGASGTVELITDTLASSGGSAGEVLGTGNVTVNGGTIKTRGGVTQKGQVRYGGNLTFGTGSKLYIGAAA